MRPAAWAPLGVVLLSSTSAQAAGFYVTDLGARALAVGGAFVAAPDGLTALHYNPAGLAGQPGFRAELDVALFASSFQLQRRCPCVFPERITDQDPTALDQALEAGFGPSESRGLQPIPFLAASYGFPWLDLTIALGAYGPHGAGYDWGERSYEAALDQAQRYSLISAESLEANYQLGVAFQPLPGLRIGASFLLYQVKSEQFLHIYANTVLTPFAENVSTLIALEGQAFDIPVALSFDAWAPNWSVGASYTLPLGFTVGASFRGPRSVDTVGRLSAEVPTILSDAGIGVANGGGPVRVNFSLPAIARVGLQYSVPELLSVEAAVVWEGWSAHQRVQLYADDVRLTVGNEPPSSLGLLELDRSWRNTASLRLGARTSWLEPWLSLAAGYFYEPSAVPRQRLSGSAIDLDKHGLSLGLGTTISGLRLELSLAHVIYQDVTVGDSEVVLPNALSNRDDNHPDAFGTDRYQTRIGNGDYQASATVVSLGVSFALDGFR